MAQRIFATRLGEDSPRRASLGSIQCEALHAPECSAVVAATVDAARSVLRDADFALESASHLRISLLQATIHRAMVIDASNWQTILQLLDPVRHAA